VAGPIRLGVAVSKAEPRPALVPFRVWNDLEQRRVEALRARRRYERARVNGSKRVIDAALADWRTAHNNYVTARDHVAELMARTVDVGGHGGRGATRPRRRRGYARDQRADPAATAAPTTSPAEVDDPVTVPDGRADP